MYAFATRTQVGYVRRRNEDTALAERLSGGEVFLAVADGIGGAPAGEVASRLAIEACAESLRRAAPRGDPRSMLEAAFEAAEAAVKAAQRGPRTGMGTTLVAGIIVTEAGGDGEAAQLSVANIGDSRAYLWREDLLQQLTTDHSWVEERIRAGKLSPDDQEASRMRHLITRSVGGGSGRDVPDIVGPRAITPGDVVLLCTDGMHGEVPDEEIAAAIEAAAGRGAETVDDDLVALALAAGGLDNVTVAVATVEPGFGRPRSG